MYRIMTSTLPHRQLKKCCYEIDMFLAILFQKSRFPLPKPIPPKGTKVSFMSAELVWAGCASPMKGWVERPSWQKSRLAPPPRLPRPPPLLLLLSYFFHYSFNHSRPRLQACSSCELEAFTAQFTQIHILNAPFNSHYPSRVKNGVIVSHKNSVKHFLLFAPLSVHTVQEIHSNMLNRMMQNMQPWILSESLWHSSHNAYKRHWSRACYRIVAEKDPRKSLKDAFCIFIPKLFSL